MRDFIRDQFVRLAQFASERAVAAAEWFDDVGSALTSSEKWSDIRKRRREEHEERERQARERGAS